MSSFNATAIPEYGSPKKRRRGVPCARTDLDNGIRVITEYVDGVRSLALGILVDASPRHEGPNQAGLAHLTEHLVFRGTSQRDARQLAQWMDLAGGQFGGFTTRDYTCFYASVLDEHGTYALDLFGDVLLNSTFTPANLEKEKVAILHELAAAQDTPGELVHDLLKERAWPNHPLGRPIGGRPESVQRLTREDVIYFLHENYLPDRIIVAAAGRVDHLDFVAQVRDAFWRMLGSGYPKRTPAPRHTPGVVVKDMGVSQVYFALGLPAYPFTHPNRYALHLFVHLLGGGISSRLFRQLREERGLVYHVGAEYQAYRDAGMVVLEGSTAPESLPAVLGLILGELAGLVAGSVPITEEELWRAQTHLRRQHLLSGELTATRLSRLATQEFYFGQTLTSEEILRSIEAVDQKALDHLLGAWLPDALKQATLAVVGPRAPENYEVGVLEELLADCQ
jgi:predicted Zn-dependent peptidase